MIPGAGRRSDRARRLAAVVTMAALVCAATAAAASDDATVTDQFEQATQLVAQDQPGPAVDALLALADRYPDADLADDALFAAAQLLEEKLGEPARALGTYQRILRDYPDSRTALASSRRADLLRADLGPDGTGASPLAAFTEIKQRFSERGAADSARRVEALLAAHPDWPGRARALVWLATVEAGRGRADAALDRYLEAADAAVDSGVAFDAYRGAGEVALGQERFDDAERYFGRMPIEGDAARQRDYDHAMITLAHARLRARLYQLSFVVVFLVGLVMVVVVRRATGSNRAALAALVRPPTECIYMIPVAAVLCAAGFRQPESIGPAVVIMCSASLVIIWLNGVALDAARRPLGRGRVLAHTAACVLAVVAICFIAVHRTRLIDQIVTTVRFGPDV